MHGLNFSIPCHFYVNASGFAAGLAITQKLKVHPDDSQPTDTPIIYDSLPFSKSQRRYPTYKRELCGLVKFTTKYDYLCKHPHLTTLIYTDHKPLTFFISLEVHEGIYGHWADQLQRLNVRIAYIPGPRNKAAYGLSRTIFKREDCLTTNNFFSEALADIKTHGPMWIWKDGPGGYNAFLDSLSQDEQDEIIENGLLHEMEVFTKESSSSHCAEWDQAYRLSDWFGFIYRFLKGEEKPKPDTLRKAFQYRIDVQINILWIY